MVQKWKNRAYIGKFGGALLGVRIKFPSGKVYKFHISDVECTVKMSLSFSINLLRETSTELMKH